MHEPQPDLILTETEPTLDLDTGQSPAALVADAALFPGTGSNEVEEVMPPEEPAAEVPRPRRRLRLKFASRRPPVPNLTLGWNTRFKIAVVLSFLILVSVLIANRVQRRGPAVPRAKEGAESPALQIAAGGEATRKPGSVNQRPATRPKSPPAAPDETASESARDSGTPPAIRNRPLTGDGLIQASGSSLDPPEPVETVEPEMSFVSREPNPDAVNPPLPASETPLTETATIPTPEPPEEPPTFDEGEPPIHVAATAPEESAVSAIEPRSAVPPRPALEQEPSETRFGALQELPLPGPGGAIGDAAAPDPAPFEPSPEETEVASPDSQPAESAEPPAVATLLAPPVDSREGLAGLSASADPSLEEPSGAALSPIPGASLPLPVADHHATTPAAMPSPPSVAMTSPTPAPSVPPAPSHPTAVVANPTPAPSNPPPEPSAPPAPASGSGEPATLVLSEVPRARVESETDVVGGRIEPITHVVRRGENFFTIARYYYGSGRFYRALWKANADRVPKIDELYVGTLILVPAPEDLDKAYIDPPRPRPVVGSSPSSSLSPGDPSRPDRDDRTERTAGRREEVELALPRVTPARSTTAPLRMTEVASEPVPTPRSAMRVHIVRQYETLRSIAREELGDSRWESELLRLNADQITDPYNLAVGLRLRLPEGSRRE